MESQIVIVVPKEQLIAIYTAQSIISLDVSVCQVQIIVSVAGIISINLIKQALSNSCMSISSIDVNSNNKMSLTKPL